MSSRESQGESPPSCGHLARKWQDTAGSSLSQHTAFQDVMSPCYRPVALLWCFNTPFLPGGCSRAESIL